MARIRTLFVDKNQDNREAFATANENNERLAIESAASLKEGINMIDDKDMIIAAYRLKDTTGPAFFEEASKEIKDTGYVLYTDKDMTKILAEVGKTHIMIIKPSDVDFDHLGDQIVKAYDNREFSSYPAADDEPERATVAERIDISDKQRKELDDITRTVAEHFNAEKAYVGLMKTKEQSFISRCGFDDKKSSREETICTHTLVHDGVYVVEDVNNDPRFENNDLIEDMDIGFYAGTILNVEGYRVGTLCITDVSKRTFSDNEKTELREYARKVETILKAK